MKFIKFKDGTATKNIEKGRRGQGGGGTCSPISVQCMKNPRMSTKQKLRVHIMDEMGCENRCVCVLYTNHHFSCISTTGDLLKVY